MNTRTLLTLAAATAALLLSGCAEMGVGARADAEGDCWASQGPAGQSAGCDFGDGDSCQAHQGYHGQAGSCRFSR